MCLSLSLFDTQELVQRMISFLIEAGYLQTSLLLQGFQQSRLKAAFRKFYGRYNNLVYQYDLSLSQMLSGVFHSHC